MSLRMKMNMERIKIKVSTLATWLRDQGKRPDAPGELSRFFDSFSHARTSSLAGVSRAVIKQQDFLASQGNPRPEVTQWIADTVAEYRSGVQEDALGTAMGPRLDRMQGQLDRMGQTLEVIRAFHGIPALAAAPDSTAAILPLT